MCRKDYVSLKPFEVALGVLIISWGTWFIVATEHAQIYASIFQAMGKELTGVTLILLGLLEMVVAMENLYRFRRVTAFLTMLFFVIIAALMLSSPNSGASFAPAVSVWLVVFSGILYFLLGRCRDGNG